MQPCTFTAWLTPAARPIWVALQAASTSTTSLCWSRRATWALHTAATRVGGQSPTCKPAVCAFPWPVQPAACCCWAPQQNPLQPCLTPTSPAPAGQGGFNTRSRRDVGSQQLESASNEALNQCYQRGLLVRLFFQAHGSNPHLKKDEVLFYAGEYKVCLVGCLVGNNCGWRA